MPTPTPDADLATRLAAGLTSALGAGYVYGTTGANIFRGPPRKPGNGIPVKAMFCLATGGPVPQQYTTDGSTSEVRYTSVQVTIRGDVEAFGAGQTLARACRDALHKSTISGYFNVEVRESEPTFIGVDDQESPRWTINVSMWAQV